MTRDEQEMGRAPERGDPLGRRRRDRVLALKREEQDTLERLEGKAKGTTHDGE